VSRYDHMPKLAISDWKALGQAGLLLDQCASTIARPNSQWRDLVLTNLAEVKRVIAALYNKGERQYERWTPRPEAVKPADETAARAPAELAPDAPSAAPEEA